MKILVIPDVHLKPWVITGAAELMKTGKYDKAVFLGDIADDFGQKGNLNLYEETFDTLEDFMKAFPQSLFCYGNHDVSYLWKKPETGYSTMAEDLVARRVNGLLTQFGKERIKFIHKIDNVVFSHAGLTREFLLHYISGNPSMDEIIDIINNNLPEGALWNDSSILWARPGTYTFYAKGCLQVAGHTPVKTITQYCGMDLIVCDTFSTHRDGRPYGNKKYLCIDTITKEWEEV